MITRHVIRPNAAEDFDEQLDYYETEGGLELALRFFGAVEEAIQFLYRYPDAGSPKEFGNPKFKGLRSWPVPGFENIRLYYLRPDENTLRIVRVLHGKRDLARILEEEQGSPQMKRKGLRVDPFMEFVLRREKPSNWKA